jgi:Domain of unknown function (DUF4259)
MGAWGAGSFDNDDAVDWVGDLGRSADGRLIRAALDAVGRLDPADYLEAPDASVAVAAAEVVAALRGRPAADLPQEVTTWVQAHGRSGVADDLRAAARAAVARVEASSELRDLWDETDDAGAAWRQQLGDLLARLAD